MSIQIPQDIIETIKNLESEATKSLSKGNYVLAERLYHVIFLSLYDRQYVEKRRIHLGAPLHMEGLSLLLQNKPNDALKSILLAYITDIVGNTLGEEDKADTCPAYKVLTEFFGLSKDTLQKLKILSHEYVDRTQPFDPQVILNKFLAENSILSENILVLATHNPTSQQIRSIRPRFYELVVIETAANRGKTNANRLNLLLNNLFINPDLGKHLPKIFTESEVHIMTILSDKYFILSFFNDNEWGKIKEFREKGLQPPLPKLIKPDSGSGPSAFRVDGGKNILFSGSQISNQYSFSLGKDSTILLIEHRQSESEELKVDYTIGLGYIVTFGQEITPDNFYDYLDNLAAYSFKIWRS